MKRVVAIIVTYNRAGMLRKSLESVLSQSKKCDIFIIDNNSSDDTHVVSTDYASRYSNISYFNTGKNIGGAGGFNYGIKKAVEKKYDLFWLMDDDCFPDNDALENLLEADSLFDSNYGYLSSVVFWSDGKECKMNRQKIKKSYYDYSHFLKNGLIQVEQSTFVSLLIPLKTVLKVGLPIKDFFIWGDDIEFTRRITKRNKIPAFMCVKSSVIHAMKENTGSSIVEDSKERLDRYKYAFRNEAFLYRQEGIKGCLFYIAKCMLDFIKIITRSENYRLRRCSILIGSMVKGMFFHPEIEMINK